MEISRLNLHWVAGLLEGDGYFPIERSGRIGIRCEMVDEDTISTLAALFGSKVYSRAGRGGNRQTTYFTEPRNGSARGILDELHPLMGRRRQTRISEQIRVFGAKEFTPVTIQGDYSSDCDVAWAAGLLEAEGSFSGWRNNVNTLKVCCTMTDGDVIDRLASIMKGSVLILAPLPSGKQSFRWHTTNAQDARECMRRIEPFMHSRRQATIRRHLETFDTISASQENDREAEFNELVRLYLSGLPLREIQSILGRGQSFVVKGVKRAREMGLVEHRYLVQT